MLARNGKMPLGRLHVGFLVFLNEAIDTSLGTETMVTLTLVLAEFLAPTC
jgi:hypothetical protein